MYTSVSQSALGRPFDSAKDSQGLHPMIFLMTLNVSKQYKITAKKLLLTITEKNKILINLLQHLNSYFPKEIFEAIYLKELCGL